MSRFVFKPIYDLNILLNVYFKGLKAQVTALHDLMETLPVGSVPETLGDLAMAVKGIVDVQKPPKNKDKPKLNQEGLDDFGI
jgi:hypothetical protein